MRGSLLTDRRGCLLCLWRKRPEQWIVCSPFSWKRALLCGVKSCGSKGQKEAISFPAQCISVSWPSSDSIILQIVLLFCNSDNASYLHGLDSLPFSLLSAAPKVSCKQLHSSFLPSLPFCLVIFRMSAWWHLSHILKIPTLTSSMSHSLSILCCDLNKFDWNNCLFPPWFFLLPL